MNFPCLWGLAANALMTSLAPTSGVLPPFTAKNMPRKGFKYQGDSLARLVITTPGTHAVHDHLRMVHALG